MTLIHCELASCVVPTNSALDRGRSLIDLRGSLIDSCFILVLLLIIMLLIDYPLYDHNAETVEVTYFYSLH